MTGERATASGHVEAPAAGDAPRPPRVISVTSGKGGVGKSNIVANLALGFARLGRRVLILDADLGLANVDLLFGLTPERNVADVLAGKASMTDILVEAADNVYLLPAASGVTDVMELSPGVRHGLLTEVECLHREFDVLLLDTAAGISGTVLSFNGAADEVVVVTTLEPTAITDAYAVIKVLRKRCGVREFSLIANNVATSRSGLEVYRRLGRAADEFLDVSLNYLGHVVHDANLERAVCARSPVAELFPESPSSLCLDRIIETLVRQEDRRQPRNESHFFWRRLLDNGGLPKAAS